MKILLVDDEEHVLDAWRALLDGFEVRTASTRSKRPAPGADPMCW
jgi:hypothetical protein